MVEQQPTCAAAIQWAGSCPQHLFSPRKRTVAGLLGGAPPHTLGMCSESGWINSKLFLQWLKFFVEQTRPTEQRPQLVIVDNHESHRADDVLECSLCHPVLPTAFNHLIGLCMGRCPPSSSRPLMHSRRRILGDG